jgi:hypothetical protein
MLTTEAETVAAVKKEGVTPVEGNRRVSIRNHVGKLEFASATSSMG